MAVDSNFGSGGGPPLTEHLTTSTSSLSRGLLMNNTIQQSISVADFATALNGVNGHTDRLVKQLLWWSLGLMAIIILVLRIYQRWRAHLRHLIAMSLTPNQQTYFSQYQTTWVWKIKKFLIYAPLKNKRHNREIRLSSAINMGTIPSRVQTLLLFLFLLSNIAYTLAVDWRKMNHYAVAAEMRGRSGVLAIVNMIPLVMFAGRNNPLIPILQVSFDTYNLLHRWTGRIVVLESVLHTACWAYVKYAATGWKGVRDQILDDKFSGWGMIATVCMMFILLISLSPIRHAFYETFINAHIVSTIGILAGVYVHCDVGKLPQLTYVRVIILLWAADRITRMLRLIWYNYSRAGWTTASVQALSGDACRVTLHCPRKFNAKPGTHAYLRFGSVNPWESHPFSIAWIEHKAAAQASIDLPTIEEKKFKGRLRESDTVTDVSFIIHAQTGMTRQLHTKAFSYQPKVLTLRAAIEGPYGGYHSLDSYGHVVLFAGSSGITHQIPFVRHLIETSTERTVATRKITLIWIIRDSDHLEWVRPWMDVILRMPGRRECLVVKLFVTRPRNPAEIRSPSNTVQMYPGRPNVPLLIQNEVSEQVGAMCVTVCGPGGLADNVREAVRDVQEDSVVDFIEESFTW
ncbi:Ferric/cupric reductase transmembrane component B [Erysiphe necator]|uniref:ferric-chelate reductase (NADPH) n=1 Tax=Uncinula necator TaxID=52586 RepID=A0A0B1P7K2_UNCNE|nr:Ferric/cupric reductase transmembrane component B [Erysiphe necator]KHJ32654.1 putative ferric-chelate reductase [Erysiphe necator]